MDQEDRDRLIRIDERTAKMAKTLDTHIADDREDFKEMHGRINRIVGRAIAMAVVVVGGIVGALGPWPKGGG